MSDNYEKIVWPMKFKTCRRPWEKLLIALPPRGVGVRSIAISLSVCLSVPSHISKATRPNFTKYSLRVNYGHGSVDSAITYVLPVMWMTSRLHMNASGKGDANRTHAQWLTRRQQGGRSLESTIALFDLIWQTVFMYGPAVLSLHFKKLGRHKSNCSSSSGLSLSGRTSADYWTLIVK